MAVKYVKDFVFGPMTSVQHYAKGGHVTKVPAKAKPAAKGMPARAKPNAPAKGAKRMESPPKVGKGQGYKDGGKVPGKQMDRLPTKTPPGRQKDLAPARPEKGQYQGYAEGGDIKDPRAMSIEPGDGGALDQYREYDPNAAFRVPDVSPMHYDTAGPLERLPPVPDEIPRNQFGEAEINPGRPTYYEGTGPAAQAFMDREQALRDEIARLGAPSTLTEATFPVATAQELKRPEPNDNAWFDSLLRLAQQEQARPSRGYLNPVEGLSGIGRAMREGAMRADIMRRPGMPGERTAMYAKGGQVKGQAKVGKVMSEYKKGELHSGSKKGPLVKNPKQAVAIALSEARKAGAKIPKKADGGPLSDKELGGKSYAGRNEPLRGKYVSREEKIMREAMAKEKQKDMERKMREAYERTQSQSVSGLKKGGMARKAVPTHKGKAMYGGGKC